MSPTTSSSSTSLHDGISPPTLAHFQSMPWVNAYLSDPTYYTLPLSRTLTPNDGHTLMAETWNTERTIAHLITFARDRSIVDKSIPSPSSPLLQSPPIPVPLDNPTLITRFYTFGRGLNAHPSLLHGGVIGAVLDSTLGAATGLHMLLPSTLAEHGAGPSDYLTAFTVDLHITYKKPVRTPGTVCARSWIVKSEGRKIFAKGWVGSEDGQVHALAEGIWVLVKVDRNAELAKGQGTVKTKPKTKGKL